MTLRTLFDSHRKHCFSDNIRVLSALEVLYDNALHKSTFYLLTYFLVQRHISGKNLRRSNRCFYKKLFTDKQTNISK